MVIEPLELQKQINKKGNADRKTEERKQYEYIITLIHKHIQPLYTILTDLTTYLPYGNTYSYCSKNETEINEITEVLRSIGYYVTVPEKLESWCIDIKIHENYVYSLYTLKLIDVLYREFELQEVEK